MGKITIRISPLALQFEIKKRKLSQRDFANILGKTDGAISGAINGDPLLMKLRQQIIELLNKDNKSLVEICHKYSKKL